MILETESKLKVFIISALALIWAFLIIAYFTLTNTNILPLWQQGYLSFKTLSHYQNLGLASVYFNLFNPYTITISNFEFISFFITIIAIIAYTIIGIYFLSILNLPITRSAAYSISFVLGLGIISIELEVFTIFKMLYNYVILACYVITFLILFIILKISQNIPQKSVIKGSSVFLFRRAETEFEREEFSKSIIAPSTFFQDLFYIVCFALISLITFLTFYHAILFPETYWDSLILYIGYAKKIFLTHAFPQKVVAQVGIGLGANYPHLYPLMSAAIATAVGYWSDIFAQVTPPLAGLLSTIFIYQIIIILSRNKLIAIASALLFRSIPDCIAYFTYASDYAIAILFTTAFLYAALMYFETNKWGYFIIATLISAFSVHINYLMWILWIVWVVFVFVSKVKISSRRFIVLFIISLLISSIWYIRNKIVTGNPVYAFFPGLFGGKNINLDVLHSAQVEWQLNGDGIGGYGYSLWKKLINSWRFFVTDPNSWKLAPTFVAFTLPGVLIFIFSLISKIKNKIPLDDFHKFGIINLSFFFLLMFYHYCIASFYLYQIIIILPAMIFFAYCLFNISLSFLYRWILLLFILFIGFFPGLPMSLMGFKFTGEKTIGGKTYNALELVAFRNPLMGKDLFYQLVYNDDVKMWQYLNTHLLGKKILTHENRYLVLDNSIELIHLDDWDIQKTYTMKSNSEKISYFKKLDIQYYLYIPNEDKHQINKKVGIQKWIGTPLLKEMYRAGNNVLYEINY